MTTSDFAHREPCVLLAQAGKHVLVEKPLATSVEDAQTIVAAVEAAGVIGCVDFHNRYHPGLRAVKQKLDKGEFGAPRMFFGRLSDRIEVATEWFSWAGKGLRQNNFYFFVRFRGDFGKGVEGSVLRRVRGRNESNGL